MADDFERRLQQGLQEQAHRVERPADPAADVGRRVRRQDLVRRSLAGAAVVVALVVVGGAALPALPVGDVVFDSDPGVADSPAPEADSLEAEDAPAPRTAACEGEQDGVRWELAYPEGWWAPHEATRRCRLFHPEVTPAPDDADLGGIHQVAVWVGVDGMSYEEAIEDVHTDRVIEHETTVVDARRASRVEVEVATETDVPAGSRVYGYVIDLDGRTLVLVTSDVLAEGDYAERRSVVDAMAESLRVTIDVPEGDPAEEAPPEPEDCSAADLPGEPGRQEELPAAVAGTRDRIVAAAVACDYDALAAITDEGFEFSFGFGDAADPTVYWRRLEAEGREPLRILVELLDRSYARIDDSDPPVYAWPSAFVYERWEDVPQADREALRPIYDDEDFEAFASFGGYAGYRVGILDDGRWSFFVAGD